MPTTEDFNTPPIGFARMTHGIHAVRIIGTEATSSPIYWSYLKKHTEWHF